MGFTTSRFRVPPDPPMLICLEAHGRRVAAVANVGNVVVFIGDSSVTVGSGIEVWPGDPPYTYDQGDELYAVANNGLVTVDERR